MNCRSVIVTRPASGKDMFSRTLQERGYRVVHEPLTHVVLRHDAQPLLARAIEEEPEAVLLTSRHGAQALAALTELRDLPLLCVGEATANAAKAHGFTRVSATGSVSRQMAEHVLASYDAGARFLYVSAHHVSTNLAAALSRQGMRMQRVVLYEAVAARQLSETLAEQMRREPMDAATFLSLRAAQIFTRLIAEAGLQDALRHMRAFALSEPIAAALREAPWKGVHAAGKPTLASLAACVDNAFENRS